MWRSPEHWAQRTEADLSRVLMTFRSPEGHHCSGQLRYVLRPSTPLVATRSSFSCVPSNSPQLPKPHAAEQGSLTTGCCSTGCSIQMAPLSRSVGGSPSFHPHPQSTSPEAWVPQAPLLCPAYKQQSMGKFTAIPHLLHLQSNVG